MRCPFSLVKYSLNKSPLPFTLHLKTPTQSVSHTAIPNYLIPSSPIHRIPPQLFCLSVPPRGYIHDGLVPSRCELLSPGPAIPIKRRRILVLLMDTRVRPRPSPPPCVNLCLKTGEGVVMKFFCFIV